jgi:hypothetical protein
MVLQAPQTRFSLFDRPLLDTEGGVDRCRRLAAMRIGAGVVMATLIAWTIVAQGCAVAAGAAAGAGAGYLAGSAAKD